MAEKFNFTEKLTQEISKEQQQGENNINVYKNTISEELTKQKEEIFETLATTRKPNKIKNFLNRFFQVWG
nr:MAG TPA: hypothetical protein [Bacteriophage sp.]